MVPKACPACAGPYLERRGFGTERVAAEISALWPHARVGRLDRDSVRRRGAAADILGSMASGALDVLVGTQMIAKGHDFPRVTLVGVISADVGLGVADFRAAERTFQLLTQVAGRAGRGADAGEAIVQTLYPKHYSILHACRQDYEAFFAEELRYREAMKYPPRHALVNVVVRALTRARLWPTRPRWRSTCAAAPRPDDSSCWARRPRLWRSCGESTGPSCFSRAATAARCARRRRPPWPRRRRCSAAWPSISIPYPSCDAFPRPPVHQAAPPRDSAVGGVGHAESGRRPAHRPAARASQRHRQRDGMDRRLAPARPGRLRQSGSHSRVSASRRGPAVSARAGSRSMSPSGSG